jgi:AcrR family transcriptional regulator
MVVMSKAERTKRFILETAAPIFNQKGISGASIDDVLAATQLTKGCLYSHFVNKEDLSDQVVEYMLDVVTTKMLQAISSKDTAAGKVFAFFDFYKDPINTTIGGGCPIVNNELESDDNFPAIKNKIASVLRRRQEFFVGILRDGIAKGEFSSNLDPVSYAYKAIAAIEGGLIICRAMDTAKPMSVLIKSLKDELKSYQQ